MPAVRETVRARCGGYVTALRRSVTLLRYEGGVFSCPQCGKQCVPGAEINVTALTRSVTLLRYEGGVFSCPQCGKQCMPGAESNVTALTCPVSFLPHFASGDVH